MVLDLNPDHLREADAPKIAADAFRLPFADRSCDVVHCSLFLHHFSDEACRELLLEMHRVARRLVLIQDLHRHPLSYWFLPLTRWLLGWHPMTVSDGMLSVAAGWTRPELKCLLRAAGYLPRATIEWHFPSFRYFIAIEKD